MLPRDDWQLAGNLLSEGKLPHMFHGIREEQLLIQK